MKNRKKTMQLTFAELVGVTNGRTMSNLCYQHYSVWLLREIWCYSDASAGFKQKVLDFSYSLVNNFRNYTAVDFIFKNHPEILAPEFMLYHEQFYRYHHSYNKI